MLHISVGFKGNGQVSFFLSSPFKWKRKKSTINNIAWGLQSRDWLVFTRLLFIRIAPNPKDMRYLVHILN